MAGWTGLEPAASGVTGRRSNQLNYHPKGTTLHGGLPTEALTIDWAEVGGRYRTRTCDSRRVKPELYQLS